MDQRHLLENQLLYGIENINLDRNRQQDLQQQPGPINHNRPSSSLMGMTASGSSDSRTSQNIWIFGYGSLCWHPGFEYAKCVTGYVRGFVRRFWQGNTTHRGTKDKPGRVATLVEVKDGITWGCAYQITGTTALNYLKERECILGGYILQYTKFYPRIATDGNAEVFGGAVPTLLYIATDENQLWLGDDKPENIARQIVECNGASGHNVEYLLRLANFMRDELQIISDDHLFELEHLVKNILIERNISLLSVMGTQIYQGIIRDEHVNVQVPTTFEYTSRVPDKKLRCLNI